MRLNYDCLTPATRKDDNAVALGDLLPRRTKHFMNKDFDCIVCGSCVVDVLVRPVDFETPIGGGRLIRSEPLVLTTGGIVSNSGITLARLGMRGGAFTYVGDDPWAEVIRAALRRRRDRRCGLVTHPTDATSTTAVLIDPSGERSFVHCVGAPQLLDRAAFLRPSRFVPPQPGDAAGLLPAAAESDRRSCRRCSPRFAKIGCLTALDAAGDGGELAPLAPVLPHLDLYVPSLAEAHHQTGEEDPQKIIAAYRERRRRGDSSA